MVNKFPRGERRTDEVENASRLWDLSRARLGLETVSRTTEEETDESGAAARTHVHRSRFLADTRGHRRQPSTVETWVDIETTRSPKNKICTRSARALLKSKLGTDSELLGVIAGNHSRSFDHAHAHGLFRNELFLLFNIVGSIFD